MSNKVALIGVGALGKALLKRLQGAGRYVQAFDVEPSALEAAKVEGAKVMGSAAAAARGASHIHVIVATDEQMLEATTGRSGVLAGASPGSVLLLHSTTLPMTTIKVAEAAKLQRVSVLDAPITGIPTRFEAGDGTFLVGGSREDVDAVRPYLLELGREVRHFGPLAQVM